MRSTREAEDEIARLMQQETTNPDERHTVTCMAMGVHALWDHLTCGWQNIGDRERLRELYRPNNKT